MANWNYNSDNSSDLKMWSEFLEKSMQIDCTLSQYLYASVMFIIFVISLFGNLLICFVIYTDKSMHTATNYYLFNLAASDLLLTFAIMIELFQHLIYQYSQLICLIQWFSVGCLWNNSILTMTALSIERYVAIWHPLLLKSNPVWRRVVKIIGLLWLLAIIESIPEILTVNLIKTSQSAVCFTIPSPLARVLHGVLAILTFVIPLIIMILVYSMIVFKVNSKQKKTSRDNVFNHRDPRRKVNRLMIAMSVSFFVCWTPFFMVRVLMSIADADYLANLAEWWSIVFKVVNVNSWFSVVLNPVLFSLMSSKFRKSLKTLWYSKIRRHAAPNEGLQGPAGAHHDI